MSFGSVELESDRNLYKSEYDLYFERGDFEMALDRARRYSKICEGRRGRRRWRWKRGVPRALGSAYKKSSKVQRGKEEEEEAGVKS